jgi:hypothetical protein
MESNELKQRRKLERDQNNLERIKKLLSDKQLRANRTNALKSTGPRTEEGKQRARLNGLRHGLTGQVSIMTEDNRREHDAFCNPITARLNPDGPLELQLANLIAHDHFCINRIHSIEDGVFALGHAHPANQIDSGAPQADVSLSEATTFLRDSKQILLMTTYESRITRNIAKTWKSCAAFRPNARPNSTSSSKKPSSSTNSLKAKANPSNQGKMALLFHPSNSTS